VRLDLTLVLYWVSLGISAAAVVLFLWLMRNDGGRKSLDVRRETKPEEKQTSEPL
jgi:hypothetical protein